MTPLLFDHLPKAAGTTLRKWFMSQYAEKDRIFNVGTPTDPIHAASILLEMEDEVAQEQYDLVLAHFARKFFFKLKDPYLVTVIRHPVDRIVSHYNFAKTVSSMGRQHEVAIRTDVITWSIAFNMFDFFGRYYDRGEAVADYDLIGDVGNLDKFCAVLQDQMGYPKEFTGQVENSSPAHMKISGSEHKELWDRTKDDRDLYQFMLEKCP